MDEELLKQLQDWTSRVPLIILGSGASVPFNLPSMWSLGKHLENTLTFEDDEDKKQFQEFKRILNEKEGDLERALSDIRLNETVLNSIVGRTWELISKTNLEAYNKFFLDDKKEKPLVTLIEYLLSTTNRKVSIVTTNYDRIAEYSASIVKSFICTGYAHNYIGHFSDSIHTNTLVNLKGYKGQVNIWKVHGSLDWFETPNKENVYLPLCENIPQGHKPLIVTPGLSKYAETHKEPYRTIFTQADTEIQNANGFLCIGYGFNDEHVQPKLIQQIKSKPIIVITKELTSKTKEAIIDGDCKNYILMEESSGNHTKVYSSNQGEHTIEGVGYWQLSEYIKLIK
ncbi:SIR2 family protein [Capnocytophaga sp. oral taxon 878]|uniref:SIR2 family protein n=1 Tax=Capnocytophaga sp. oral taxon 878 TaxID=1316596 RepID=UPI000D036C83|nr:SIR2 family protein [Capnocytophaga sp. oral taxon 878]AVM49412.1 SIR2 family protein [Capnocytophaga sp. oral taxon 878]